MVSESNKVFILSPCIIIIGKYYNKKLSIFLTFLALTDEALNLEHEGASFDDIKNYE